jgi:hypothetical protein
VARDLAEGRISAEAATRDYGLALDAQGRIDTAATQQLRGDRSPKEASA